MIPDYMQKLYPAAVDGTLLQDSSLEIEVIPGNGLCRSCGQIFNLLKEKGICPECSGKEFELLSGKEFYIKEIVCC
jgi:hydrogenase nickel incorporation protein HypA/HybF